MGGFGPPIFGDSMKPEELIKKLGGTKGLNRMKAVVDGKTQIIARLSGAEYELTALGARLAAKFNAEASIGLAEDKPKRRVSKPKAPKVEEAKVEEAPAKGLFDLPEDA